MQVVDTDGKVEEKPDDDDGCEKGADLGCSDRLYEEEHDKYGTSDADNGRSAQIGPHNLDSLNGAEDRLGRCQDAVGEDHGNTQDADYLENESCRVAPLNEISRPSSRRGQLGTSLALQANDNSLWAIGVAADNIGVSCEEGVYGKGTTLAIIVG